MGFRNKFNESWLFEMPQRTGVTDLYINIVEAIEARIAYDPNSVTHAKDDLFKIMGRDVFWYWYQKDSTIVLGCELHKFSQGLAVNITGKNPEYRGKPPRASQLYHDIIQDTNNTVCLYSDDQLSDEGYKIWKNLFKLGNHIGVYDKSNTGQSFIPLTDISDMDNYIVTSPNFLKYRYVISESGEMFGNLISIFESRRLRELSGLNLFD